MRVSSSPINSNVRLENVQEIPAFVSFNHFCSPFPVRDKKYCFNEIADFAKTWTTYLWGKIEFIWLYNCLTCFVWFGITYLPYGDFSVFSLFLSSYFFLVFVGRISQRLLDRFSWNFQDSLIISLGEILYFYKIHFLSSDFCPTTKRLVTSRSQE